jgi:transmembrane sensor
MKSTPPAQTRPDREPNKVHPLDWPRSAGEMDLVEQKLNAAFRRKRRTRRRAIGAGAIAVLGLAGTFWFSRPSPIEIAAASPAFVVGPMQQHLADGSIVDLKDDAKISVAFETEIRRVTLDRGEAHFRVAKIPRRPFIVGVDGIEVRAVGTAFSVQRDAGRVHVLVAEGTVEVGASPKTIAASAPILVGAGRRVSMETAAAQAPEVVPVSSAELTEELSWRVPRVRLKATALAEVIPLFNEHGRVYLTLADPEIGKLQLTGTLRADNISVLLEILESSFGVKAECEAGGRIRLHRP